MLTLTESSNILPQTIFIIKLLLKCDKHFLIHTYYRSPVCFFVLKVINVKFVIYKLIAFWLAIITFKSFTTVVKI